MVALRAFFVLLLIPEGLFLLMPKYKVTLISLGRSEDSTILDISNLKLKGRERILNGTFDLLEDMDDEHYSFAGDMWHDAQGDGNFKLYPFAINQHAICKAYKSYRSYLQKSGEYGVQTNFPIHMDVCPIERGTYYLKNVTLSTETWPSVTPRGYVRVHGYFYKDDKLVGNYSITGLFEDI